MYRSGMATSNSFDYSIGGLLDEMHFGACIIDIVVPTRLLRRQFVRCTTANIRFRAGPSFTKSATAESRFPASIERPRGTFVGCSQVDLNFATLSKPLQSQSSS